MPVALAWEVFQWSGDPNAQYTPIGVTQTIEINRPAVYKFYATTGGASGDLAPIYGITVNFPQGTSGTVTVYILRSPATGGGPGCTTLGAMNLRGTGVTHSYVYDLNVQNGAATIGVLDFEKLYGPCNVGGVGITNAVSLDTLAGNITCAALGDLSVSAGVGNSPVISTTQSYAGTLYIASSINAVGGFVLGARSGVISRDSHLLSARNAGEN